MENQSSKKKAERQVLDGFRKVYEDFPKGKIIESESPDFIIKPKRKRTIGIELIQIFPENFEIEITRKNFISNVAKAISKKEEKLNLYQKKILENYWLLISTEQRIPENFNVPTLLGKIKSATLFDRVFLFDKFRERAFEVKVG